MVAASRSAPRQRMSNSVVFAAYCLRGMALACLLATANCAQFPPTSSVAIPSIPSGAARLWFYRDYEPHDVRLMPAEAARADISRRPFYGGG
jgi:hypothetical protein